MAKIIDDTTGKVHWVYDTDDIAYMLKIIQDEIKNIPISCDSYNMSSIVIYKKQKCNEVIQEKINMLKEQEDGKV